jgi:hypothetical protein
MSIPNHEKQPFVVHGYRSEDGAKRIQLFRPITNEGIYIAIPKGGLSVVGDDVDGSRITVEIGYYYGVHKPVLGFWARLWRWIGVK